MGKKRIKKQKDLKLSVKRIIKDNLMMLELIHKESPGFILISIITILLPVCAEFVSGTLILRYTLNSINKGRSFTQISILVVFWMVIYLVMSGIRSLYDEQIYNVRILDVRRNLYTRIYQKASSVELGCYENPEYYNKFAKAIDECGDRADETIQAVRDVIYRFTALLLNFTLIIIIDPVLLLFIFIPLLVAPIQTKVNIIGYQEKMEIKEEKRRKDYSRRVFYLADYAKEMRLLNMPVLMLMRFRESGERVIGIIKKYGFSLAILNYIITECNEMLTILGATLYAAWQTFSMKRMGYGDCLVIVNSIDTIASVLTNSTRVILKFQENALYIENLREFLDYRPRIKSGNTKLPDDGDIVLENVSFCYEGATENTLKNISMRFGKKEKIAIVGHNGAGKTTLVKLLLRLYDAEGSITYGGVDIKEFSLSEYRDMFSSVMQDFHIFALSVAENVMMDVCDEKDRKLIMEAIKKGGISPKINQLAYGIDTMMSREFDEKGVQMSGGEQQKLAISHVYSKQNRYVILDEPSSALDPIAEYEMYNRMLDACSNCGMIFISHRLSSAVLADRVYLLENGEVIESGSHNELMALDGKYAQMFKRQAMSYTEALYENEQ